MWKQRPANLTCRSGRQAQATEAAEGASAGNDEMASQDWKVSAKGAEMDSVWPRIFQMRREFFF